MLSQPPRRSWNGRANFVAMSAIAAYYGTEKVDTDKLLSALEAGRQATTAPSDDFWSRAALADARLAAHLVEGTLAGEDAVTEIAGLYEKAFASGSSARGRLTIAQHLEILRDLLPADRTTERENLSTIARRLRTWTSQQ
jgi:hypothetical protein